jgi:two-component system, LytTR family, response regulator
MIRVMVVDDEPLVRERLRTLLAVHADVQVVGERGDGPSALEAFRELAPQLVFLDIQMPGLSGLEVAAAWRAEGSLPVIVFVTAFDEFAVEAFRLHALDYLTKPIDPERFAESLDRARELLQRPDRDELDRRIESMLDAFERRQAVRPHIVVRVEDRYLIVPAGEIQALEAMGNHVCVHCDRATYTLRSTLAALEARLDPQRFLRTHRSWIVNLDKVREAQPWAKGSWILLTRNGLQVPVGQQYHTVLQKILG